MGEMCKTSYAGGKVGIKLTVMPALGAPPSQHVDVFTNSEATQILLFKNCYRSFVMQA